MNAARSLYSAQSNASTFGDVGDGLGKRLRWFLGGVVPDAALDGPVRVLAREFFRVGAGLRVRCAVGITFKRDSGHRDHRKFGEPRFERGVFRLALGQAE